ncbi:uncharacterized protein PV09_08009 [Verruconis gallopava]|uniref:DUF1446 domain-containing protein n=1 Tax=Verruconis gallopava TaxID=253628 RepID=A0A0D2A1F0_9PEZI|nr:uncharacterized protein PV09_08009 [Verruconis gallopava]KIW00488.1 hypothetical protein PV09_08009 [Verruconis gallopava]
MGSLQNSRPIRIQNISGSPVDRRDALYRAVTSSEPIDVFVGDWMSELNMPMRAFAMATEGESAIGYEPSYIESLEPALPALAQKRVKFVANGGCVAAKELFDIVVQMVVHKGLDLNVAWIEGDIVTDLIKSADPSKQVSICTGQTLADWPYEPLFGQCYLGGWAIAKALEAGADIVICGRCADASPIIGAAAWWHNWQRTDFDYLASSLIAGHLIECSTYVTGGNYTGFKSMDWSSIHDLGYPIAEISHDGDVVITKPDHTGGLVTPVTCSEQLLYEIQGKYYLNSDVTAVIDNVQFTKIGKDRVRMSGVTGLPPPATTKAGVTALGGYRVEMNWALVGLDINEKKKLFEVQLRHSLGKERLAKLSCLDLTVYGSVEENPKSQNAATVDMRLVVQSRDYDAVSEKNLAGPVFSFIMQTFPAATYTNKSITPKAFQEYFPTLIPQPTVTVHFSKSSMQDITVLPPTTTLSEPMVQPDYGPTDAADLWTFGPTARAPLGRIVHARAGDKGSNCNVGFFPAHPEAWPWLRSFLSTPRLIELIGDDYKGQKIDRMEFPKINAVHFLLHDWLDRGVVANASYDILGKFISEYIRCKVVDIPEKFLAMGTI